MGVRDGDVVPTAQGDEFRQTLLMIWSGSCHVADVES